MALILRFERFAWDAGGLLILTVALMTLLAVLFPSWARGVLISWWAGTLQRGVGYGTVWVISGCAVLGFWMLSRRYTPRPVQIPWGKVLSLEIAALASLGLLSVIGGTSLERVEQGVDGGIVGWGMAELLRILLEPVGLAGNFWRGLLLGAVFVFFAMAGVGLFDALLLWAKRASAEVETAAAPEATALDMGPAVAEAPLPGQAGELGGAMETSDPTRQERSKRKITLPPQFRKNFHLPSEKEAREAAPPPPRDDRLPPLNLLINEQSSRPDERHINLTAGLIEKTLAEFGIPVRVVGFRVGPTVTQFAVEPGFLEKEKPGTEGEVDRQKIRVAKIAGLHRDLALALSAERLRIEAPVPGRPYVGIEVPNSRTTMVRLRPLLESEAFYKINSSLAIGLGRDVSGQPVVADLARMPHLLIAGTTGSGKSICIAGLTTCLVMNNSPVDLRLVMIDPKMVELVRFNGLPHLLGKVETDVERILAVLRWTTNEMDRRYKLLEASRSRNIDTYNRKAQRRKGEEPLPRLVIMIDELADLMMNAPDQTEHSLVRLAQMARAVGIHLVVATQRPSTDVVTGLIKANFPARIAFAVASSIDSRVILDTQGAESLLGRGDMLFLPPEAPAPVRAQGALVTDHEVEKVITFWQKTHPPQEAEKAPWDQMLEDEAVLADRDDLVQQAIRIVQETQKASASMLQRRLKIGYPRAARLIDELEELGVIGPPQGGGRDREVLIGPDDDRDYDSRDYEADVET